MRRDTILGWSQAILTLCVLVYATMAACVNRVADTDERPNIVFYLADDWSWPYAGIYGDKVVKTPGFDRVARKGVLFTHAFSPTPSCTASRVSILTGQYPHRLDEGGNLCAKLAQAWKVYPDLLEEAGYFVGRIGKGCEPSTIKGTTWKHDPAGKRYPALPAFLDSIQTGKAFCLWVGDISSHRPYKRSGIESGMSRDSVVVPGYLPDTDAVREDFLDYYLAVQVFDRGLRYVLRQLKQRNLLENTIVVVSSDNGIPFPRAKANCYDAGMRVPLAIMWQKKINPGQVSDAFVHLSDLAPTFLEVAGLDPLPEMTGRSLIGLLGGKKRKGSFSSIFVERSKRDRVFVERERHGLGRGGKPGQLGYLSYPIRGVRTKEFLYLINFRSDLWPACDPPVYQDVDNSPTKSQILKLKGNVNQGELPFFELGFGKRPAEELYDVGRRPLPVEQSGGTARVCPNKK